MSKAEDDMARRIGESVDLLMRRDAELMAEASRKKGSLTGRLAAHRTTVASLGAITRMLEKLFKLKAQAGNAGDAAIDERAEFESRLARVVAAFEAAGAA